VKRDLLIIGDSHPDHILAVRAAKFAANEAGNISPRNPKIIEFESGVRYAVWQTAKRQTVKRL